MLLMLRDIITGVSVIYLKDFCIERRIGLPPVLSKGVLQADLFIHHPMVEYYLKAVRCCLLECEGFQSGFGHALTQTSNGFIGLEDIKV